MATAAVLGRLRKLERASRPVDRDADRRLFVFWEAVREARLECPDEFHLGWVRELGAACRIPRPDLDEAIRRVQKEMADEAQRRRAHREFAARHGWTPEDRPPDEPYRLLPKWVARSDLLCEASYPGSCMPEGIRIFLIDYLLRHPELEHLPPSPPGEPPRRHRIDDEIKAFMIDYLRDHPCAFNPYTFGFGAPPPNAYEIPYGGDVRRGSRTPSAEYRGMANDSRRNGPLPS